MIDYDDDHGDDDVTHRTKNWIVESAMGQESNQQNGKEALSKWS